MHGIGLTRVLSYQVAHLVEREQLRIVLASAEPPPHLVTLPGALPRIAQAFNELAALGLHAALR